MNQSPQNQQDYYRNIRQQMRRRRRAIGLGAHWRAAHQLAKQVSKLSVFRHSQHIAFYWPADGEISLKPLMALAWRKKKSCYLPVIEEDHLVFVNILPGSEMVRNRYGIPEPYTGGLINTENLDLLLMPLVAFDAKGHRIGMGGGFYDRTLSACARPSHQAQPFLLGVGHQCQRLGHIKAQPWDIPMHAVVTNRGLQN